MTSMNQWKKVMKSLEDFNIYCWRFSWQVSYCEYGGDGGRGVANMKGKMGFQTGNNKEARVAGEKISQKRKSAHPIIDKDFDMAGHQLQKPALQMQTY
jgi:hypothetical protein